ncbi:MAG: signal peptidase I [Candidatus Brennerbacteria bacterium]|nr:signal peptidase I [Candidatus Brennerbacteria bacterium]
MKKVLHALLEVFQTVVLAVVAVLFVRAFVAQPFLVYGASMEPTFSDGDYLLVDELTPRFRELARGEVVVFRYPGDERSFYIKRVIGLPGEHITIENDLVTVTKGGISTVLAEPYVARNLAMGNVDVALRDGEYYVLGDNRGFSFDSRSWGPLADDHVVGLVRMRLWPFSSALAFSAPTY